MGIHIRPRDAVSRRAAAASIGPAARRIVEAVAASTTALQTVSRRSPRHPASPAEALAALVQLRQAQAQVDAETATYLAWLQVAGVTRSAMARALGVRPETVARMLAPAAPIAQARGCDLVEGADGSWAVHRVG